MILQPERILPRPARHCLGALLTCLGVLAAHGADASPRMMLLDGVVAGDQTIVVGERGTILRTADGGRSWQRAAVDAAATFTAITFAPDGRNGWVVGHDALILTTSDGGRSWRQQYRGHNLQDSFLDVLALDAERVIAVGGYGLYASTTDGGRTWHRRKILPDDSHLNRISRGPTGTLYLAGEHGTLLRSTNGGRQWTPIPAPYEGSFYGILPLDARTLLAHGLTGHLYQSNDDGATWARIATPQPVLLATAIRTRGGRLLIAGQARGAITSTDSGGTFTALAEPGTGVAELLELPDGRILALGEAGATIVSLPAR